MVLHHSITVPTQPVVGFRRASLFLRWLNPYVACVGSPSIGDQVKVQLGMLEKTGRLVTLSLFQVTPLDLTVTLA